MIATFNAWHRVRLALLAWAPALLYIGHWSAPALLRPAATDLASRAHTDSGSGVATLLAHGHGGGDGGHAAVAPLLAPLRTGLPLFAPPAAVETQTPVSPDGIDISPDPPPPR